MENSNISGVCICINCKTEIPHIKGEPCRDNNCPKCGKNLMRKGSYHHKLYLKKIGESNNESSSTDQGECC